MKSNIRKFKFVKPVIKNPRDPKELIKEINKIKADEEVKRIKTEMMKTNEDLNDYQKKKRDEEKDERLVRSYFDKNIMSTAELGPEQYDKLIELSKTNPKAFREMMDNKILKGMDKQLDVYKRAKQDQISYRQLQSAVNEKEHSKLFSQFVKQTNAQTERLTKDTDLTGLQVIEALPVLREYIMKNMFIFDDKINSERPRTLKELNELLSEDGFEYIVRGHVFRPLQEEAMKEYVKTNREAKKVVKIEQAREINKEVRENEENQREEKRKEREANKRQKEFQELTEEIEQTRLNIETELAELIYDDASKIDDIYKIDSFDGKEKKEQRKELYKALKNYAKQQKVTVPNFSEKGSYQEKISALVDSVIRKQARPHVDKLYNLRHKYPAEFKKDINLFKKRGGRIISNSIKDLKTRLKILMGEINAGNKKNPILKAEIAEIIDFLYQKKHLTREAHKAVTKMLSLHKFVMKK